MNNAVYRKPTAGDAHIRNSSNQAAAMKEGTMRNLAWRVEKISGTTEEEKRQRMIT